MTCSSEIPTTTANNPALQLLYKQQEDLTEWFYGTAIVAASFLFGGAVWVFSQYKTLPLWTLVKQNYIPFVIAGGASALCLGTYAQLNWNDKKINRIRVKIETTARDNTPTAQQ